MGTILSQRERWIIRREDGKILCGLAQNYVFKAPEELQSTAIKGSSVERVGRKN